MRKFKSEHQKWWKFGLGMDYAAPNNTRVWLWAVWNRIAKLVRSPLICDTTNKIPINVDQINGRRRGKDGLYAE